MNESPSLRKQFWAAVVKELRYQLAVKDARIKELEELVWWWKAEAERLSIALNEDQPSQVLWVKEDS